MVCLFFLLVLLVGDHLVNEKEADCLALRWSMVSVLSVLDCLLFFLASSIGGEAGAGCLAFLVSVVCVLSVMDYLLLLMVSLIDNHLVGEAGAGCLAFLWSEVCVLSVMVCLLDLFASLVDLVAPCKDRESSSLCLFLSPCGLCSTCNGLLAFPLSVIGRL